MAKTHWTAALQNLEGAEPGMYGPESFRDYLRQHGHDPRNYRTAAEISVDTLSDLSQELADNDTVVLRLGSAPEGRGTQFVLIRVPDQLDDFFIHEDDFLSAERVKVDCTPDGDSVGQFDRETREMLEAYRMLPNFSEASLINLALSAGLFSRALNLDVDRIGTAPATIASTFDFRFEAHPTLPRVLHHNSGQVEIDALAVTRRNGKRVLLVVEAKTGSRRSLAKHKLGYPSFAAETVVSNSIDEIVPVYLRAQPAAEHIRYDIYECTSPSIEREAPLLSEMEVIADTHYKLELV